MQPCGVPSGVHGRHCKLCFSFAYSLLYYFILLLEKSGLISCSIVVGHYCNQYHYIPYHHFCFLNLENQSSFFGDIIKPLCLFNTYIFQYTISPSYSYPLTSFCNALHTVLGILWSSLFVCVFPCYLYHNIFFYHTTTGYQNISAPCFPCFSKLVPLPLFIVVLPFHIIDLYLFPF